MNFNDWFVLAYLNKNNAKVKDRYLAVKDGTIDLFDPREPVASIPRWIVEHDFPDRSTSKSYDFAERARKVCETDGIDILTLESEDYPQSLLAVRDPPPILYVKGSSVSDVSPSVSIVGSRKASEYALRFTDKVAECLAANGITIVSGLADGIDKAAHLGAIENDGTTVACLGYSLRYSPKKADREYIERILKTGGAVVSETAPWTKFGMTKRGLVQRNRIISALSDIVIIGECDEKSGTMRTYDFAREQGKRIYMLKPKVRQQKDPHHSSYQHMCSLHERDDIPFLDESNKDEFLELILRPKK
jgi:DNA processing protein